MEEVTEYHSKDHLKCFLLKEYLFFLKKYKCQYWNTSCFYSKFTDIIILTLQFSRYNVWYALLPKKAFALVILPFMKYCHLTQYRGTNQEMFPSFIHNKIQTSDYVKNLIFLNRAVCHRAFWVSSVFVYVCDCQC